MMKHYEPGTYRFILDTILLEIVTVFIASFWFVNLGGMLATGTIPFSYGPAIIATIALAVGLIEWGRVFKMLWDETKDYQDWPL